MLRSKAGNKSHRMRVLSRRREGKVADSRIWFPARSPDIVDKLALPHEQRCILVPANWTTAVELVACGPVAHAPGRTAQITSSPVSGIRRLRAPYLQLNYPNSDNGDEKETSFIHMLLI